MGLLTGLAKAVACVIGTFLAFTLFTMLIVALWMFWTMIYQILAGELPI